MPSSFLIIDFLRRGFLHVRQYRYAVGCKWGFAYPSFNRYSRSASEMKFDMWAMNGSNDNILILETIGVEGNGFAAPAKDAFPAESDVVGNVRALFRDEKRVAVRAPKRVNKSICSMLQDVVPGPAVALLISVAILASLRRSLSALNIMRRELHQIIFTGRRRGCAPAVRMLFPSFVSLYPGIPELGCE